MKTGKLALGSIIILIILILAAFLRPPFLWSLNPLSYLPIRLIFAAFISGLIIYLFLWKAALLKTATPDAVLFPNRMVRIVLFVIIGIILVLLMYQFRSATYLWGDGYLRIIETEAGMKSHFAEPLDKFVQFIVYDAIGGQFDLSAAQTHRMISIFGGLLFYAIGIWFVFRIAGPSLHRLIIGSLLFSSAMIQLFFGYVESYSISTPLLLLAVGLAYYGSSKSRPIVWGIIIFFLACLFHMSLLAYYPAFLLLAILSRNRHKRHSDLYAIILTIILPILLALAAIILNRQQFESGFGKNIFDFLLIPILPNATGYWLFSPRHILDIINQLLLVTPAGLIILFSGNPFRAIQKKDTFPIFLAALSVCGLLFLFLFNTAFGIGRDWDLFGSIAIPINLLAGFVLINRLSTNVKPRMAYIFAPILPALIITTAFILSNSRAESTVERYRDIIGLTTHGQHLNLENLADYYKDREDTANYYAALRGAAEVAPHPRYYFKIGQQYLADGLTSNAIDNFFSALKVDSTHIPSLNYLGMTYDWLGEDDPQLYELAESFFRLLLTYDSAYANAWYNLGNVYAHKARYDQTIKVTRRSIELDPENNSAYANIAYAFRKTGDYDSSEHYYKLLLSRDPNRFDSYISLAKLYQEIEDFDQAEEVLRDADMLFIENEQKIEIARTYALMNGYQRAILILREIIESGESPLDGYIILANLYYILDQKADGLRTLSSANRLYNDPSSLLSIAETFLQLSAKDSAELYLYKSIKIYPQFTPGYQKLALFYLLRNDTEKARDVLETGLEKIQNPQDRELLNSTLQKIIQN